MENKKIYTKLICDNLDAEVRPHNLIVLSPMTVLGSSATDYLQYITGVIA